MKMKSAVFFSSFSFHNGFQLVISILGQHSASLMHTKTPARLMHARDICGVGGGKGEVVVTAEEFHSKQDSCNMKSSIGATQIL